jgi:hypothetical protein
MEALLFVLALTSVVPQPHRAVVDEPQPSPAPKVESSWSMRPFALDLRFGVAAPNGAVGFGLDYSPVESLSLECGLGTNFLGPVVDCGARMRLVLGRKRDRAIYIGAGASVGPHSQNQMTRLGALAVFVGPMMSMGHTTYSASYSWDTAYFANFEIGYESRSQSGATIRAFAGVASLLNVEDGVATDPAEDEYTVVLEPAQTLLYAGFAWGRAF